MTSSDTLGSVWQTLEDKMMLLITENERLHKENAILKFEREEHAKRLYNLISLIDSVSKFDINPAGATLAGQPKPIPSFMASHEVAEAI